MSASTGTGSGSGAPVDKDALVGGPGGLAGRPGAEARPAAAVSGAPISPPPSYRAAAAAEAGMPGVHGGTVRAGAAAGGAGAPPRPSASLPDVAAAAADSAAADSAAAGPAAGGLPEGGEDGGGADADPMAALQRMMGQAPGGPRPQPRQQAKPADPTFSLGNFLTALKAQNQNLAEACGLVQWQVQWPTQAEPNPEPQILWGIDAQGEGRFAQNADEIARDLTAPNAVSSFTLQVQVGVNDMGEVEFGDSTIRYYNNNPNDPNNLLASVAVRQAEEERLPGEENSGLRWFTSKQPHQHIANSFEISARDLSNPDVIQKTLTILKAGGGKSVDLRFLEGVEEEIGCGDDFVRILGINYKGTNESIPLTVRQAWYLLAVRNGVRPELGTRIISAEQIDAEGILENSTEAATSIDDSERRLFRHDYEEVRWYFNPSHIATNLVEPPAVVPGDDVGADDGRRVDDGAGPTGPAGDPAAVGGVSGAGRDSTAKLTFKEGAGDEGASSDRPSPRGAPPPRSASGSPPDGRSSRDGLPSYSELGTPPAGTPRASS